MRTLPPFASSSEPIAGGSPSRSTSTYPVGFERKRTYPSATAPILAAGHVVRQHDADRRAALDPGLDVQLAVDRPGALGDRGEGRAGAVAGPVVRDHRVDRAVLAGGDRDRDARGRAAPDREVEGLADDLVERDLRLLGQRLAAVDVEVELDPVRDPELLGERGHRRAEPLVAQDDGLQVEREVAERADRLPVPL